MNDAGKTTSRPTFGFGLFKKIKIFFTEVINTHVCSKIGIFLPYEFRSTFVVEYPLNYMTVTYHIFICLVVKGEDVLHALLSGVEPLRVTPIAKKIPRVHNPVPLTLMCQRAHIGSFLYAIRQANIQVPTLRQLVDRLQTRGILYILISLYHRRYYLR